MKLLTILPACVCALLISTSAFASDGVMTAGDLQQICLSSDVANKVACRFYIKGVTAGIEMGMLIADGKVEGVRRPCIPDNTSDQLIEMAVKGQLGQELMLFPDDQKLDASGVISANISSFFPCKK
jgi:hypothetical protein